MSLPLWRTFFLISMPCSSKNPFLIPRSIGSAFAIGSVASVIVCVARFAEVAGTARTLAATSSAASGASRFGDAINPSSFCQNGGVARFWTAPPRIARRSSPAARA